MLGDSAGGRRVTLRLVPGQAPGEGGTWSDSSTA